MALFFDQTWFDAQLEARDLTHEALAAALTMPLTELVAIWKDQREVSSDEVRLLAEVLNVSPAKVASRAGVSTPMPKPEGVNSAGPTPGRRNDQDLLNRIEQLEVRVRTLEADIKNLRSMR